jgi:hypothetical protein
VTETQRACAVSCVGAAIGATVAYMFFTDRGRQLRQQLEPALEDIARELSNFRGTVAKAAGVANEGWRLLNDAIGDSSSGHPGRYTNPHQSSPF